VLELLTGTGLAASAGLNAYIPLLAIGLLARFSSFITLPAGWQWLENGWTLAILVLLLAIEFVADKVPALDSVNDAVQTFVRPTAGGLAFGAGATSQTTTVQDPGSFFASNQWVPVASGVVIALAVHAAKALARPVINTVTAGFGAPVVSTVEDAASITMSVVAIIIPVLVIFFLVAMALLLWALLLRRARRRAERAARGRPDRAPGGAVPQGPGGP
jgi:large-conductance mechanosensitive channel